MHAHHSRFSLRRVSVKAAMVLGMALCFMQTPLWAQQNSGQSTVYKWVDENGELHYGQTLPPEYKDLAHERLSNSGTVVDRTDRTLTPEERKALRDQEAVTRRLQVERDAREKKDRLLLAAYRSEQDILEVMGGELEVLEEQQELIGASVRDQRNSLRDLVAQAADFERVGQPVPAEVQNPIASIKGVIVRQSNQLNRLKEQLAFSRKNYEEDLARYRSLTQEGQ
jgi:hypothetical protein